MELERKLQSTDYLPRPASMPATGLRRDTGLWLLSSRASRRHAWRRLRTEEAFTATAPAYAASDFIKRALDIIIAIIALVLLSPCMACLWLLIKLDSPGPAVFHQTRTGRLGREFVMLKFRSMRSGVAPYAKSPCSANDPRVTRLGSQLRRSSLDELPQLINVLRGEMSLVGPRPEMPFIVATYSADQRRRLDVVPGMTGLWQVSPARSAPIHENVYLDLHYIQNRNCLMDLVILARTLSVVMGGPETA